MKKYLILGILAAVAGTGKISCAWRPDHGFLTTDDEYGSVHEKEKSELARQVVLPGVNGKKRRGVSTWPKGTPNKEIMNPENWYRSQDGKVTRWRGKKK